MAARLNWAKRGVNAVWELFGQEAIFKNTRVAGLDSNFSGAATANPLDARGSTGQSIDSTASTDNSGTRIAQLLPAWPEQSTSVELHQEGKKTEELQAMPTLEDRLAKFKGKELSDVDIENIYSIIVEEIKNASEQKTTPNVIIQNISKDLGILNLTPEHLEKLLSKILESKDDNLVLVHATFKKIISGYENNARLPNMCQEIVAAARLANDSGDRSKLLDTIHLLIQEAIDNKRPVDAVRKALEKIRNEDRYNPKVSLSMEDLASLLSKAMQSVTEIPEGNVTSQIDSLQQKMIAWLSVTSYDGHGNIIEPVSIAQYEEMLQAIVQVAEVNGEKYFPAYMATLCCYIDHFIDRDAIEGSTKIGVFSGDIKNLLQDPQRKFKKELSEKPHENHTNTLNIPESTGDLSTSSTLRDAALLPDDPAAILNERAPADAFSPRTTKPPTKR